MKIKFFNYRNQLALTLLLGIAIASIAKPACSQTPVEYSISKTAEFPPFDIQRLQAEIPLDFSPILANLELTIPAIAQVEPSIQPEVKKQTPENSQYIIAPR